MSSASRQEFAAPLGPIACPIPVLAGECGSRTPTSHRSIPREGHGEEWVPAGETGTPKALPKPGGPEVLVELQRWWGMMLRKGLSVPRGGERDGQTGVCRAAVCFLTQN